MSQGPRVERAGRPVRDHAARAAADLEHPEDVEDQVAPYSDRTPAGGRTRPRPPAPNRPSGPRRDDERVNARRAERRGMPRPGADEPLAASWDPVPEPARRARRSGTGGVFARVLRGYGWRAYALPVLVVLSVVALVDVANSPSEPQSTAGGSTETAAPDDVVGDDADIPEPLIPNPSGPGFEAAKASAELPGGGPFTVDGAGVWTLVPGAGPQVGTGRLFTYSVEIEDGVQVEGGPAGFAATVDATLANPKSWTGTGQYAFQRVDDGEAADIRVSLTSQMTTRDICGFRIPFDASCWNRDEQRVIINTARWARGAVAFQGNVVQYQQYVINHEVGHGLGFPHAPCPRSGELAPVMLQQTWGVANDYLAALGTDRVRADGQVCEPNAWPFPTVN